MALAGVLLSTWRDSQEAGLEWAGGGGAEWGCLCGRGPAGQVGSGWGMGNQTEELSALTAKKEPETV